jgi:hypothetical protein
MKYLFIIILLNLNYISSINAFKFNLRKIGGPCPIIKKDTKKLKYMIDIDGTICKNLNSDYVNSKPIVKNINFFNKLFLAGHEVHYWTARGSNSGKNWDALTVSQLDYWGVFYTSVNMGKPHYDVWIDDKAINADELHLVKYFPCNNKI